MTKPDKILYEIEIINITRPTIKLNYGSEFDEWRSCDELGLPIRLVKFYVPGKDSLEDRYNSFYDSLLREIKKRL